MYDYYVLNVGRHDALLRPSLGKRLLVVVNQQLVQVRICANESHVLDPAWKQDLIDHCAERNRGSQESIDLRVILVTAMGELDAGRHHMPTCQLPAKAHQEGDQGFDLM